MTANAALIQHHLNLACRSAHAALDRDDGLAGADHIAIQVLGPDAEDPLPAYRKLAECLT